MCRVWAAVLAPASSTAPAPACGCPAGSVSIATGGLAAGGGGGGGGSPTGSGNETPSLTLTLMPLLDASQRSSPGLGSFAATVAAFGITSHGPAADPSGGAWPNAAHRNEASPPAMAVASKVKLTVSSPCPTVETTVPAGPASLPARSWQVALQSVRSSARV